MRRKWRISVCALLHVLTVIEVTPTKSARAQVSEAQIVSAIETARSSGVAISDQEVQNILKIYREQSAHLSQMHEELQWQDEPTVQGLEHPLSHSKGQEGIPFPDPSQVVLQPFPTEAPGELQQPTQAPIWSPEPYERPGRCERNETKRKEHTPTGNDSVTYIDTLFLSEDLVPLDSSEVYGPRVSLIPYGPNESEATFVRMEVYRVPCVPYRMRSTGKADYIDTGVNALKNYTANPAGKGVLHTFVEQKLNPQKHNGGAPTRPRRG